MVWGIWGITALILVIVEMLLVDFTFLMLAIGALAGMVTALATDNLTVQILVAVIVGILGLIFVRPYFKRRFNADTKAESNVYALVGEHGTALTAVTNTGRVKLRGEVWTARTGGEPIAAQSTVVVTAVEGATLVVVPTVLAASE